ncbi:uncharacterized protein LOC141674718 [Apium graveolens]|uniref:uncharacterized protein LOC141674718 n=1 Tax=Apium graveolens TaxID=4045 RepID=UPI003D79B78D
MINHMFHEWQRVQVDSKTYEEKQQLRKLYKHPPGWSKINVDTSYQAGVTHIGAGCIIRDDQGQFILAKAARVRGVSTREAEALSFKEALTWTKNWRTRMCIFELDAKMVVDVVNGTRKNSNFHGIIHECKKILKHFKGVLVVLDHRFANRVAHVLTQMTCSMSNSMEWSSTAPDLIFNLIAGEY